MPVVLSSARRQRRHKHHLKVKTNRPIPPRRPEPACGVYFLKNHSQKYCPPAPCLYLGSNPQRNAISTACRSENGTPSQVSSGFVSSVLSPCTWNLNNAPGRS